MSPLGLLVTGLIFSRKDFAMLKTLFGATALTAVVFAVSSAYAMGGGPTPPSASPYAILEPQTVGEGWGAANAIYEGRSAFTGEYGAPHPQGEGVHERRRAHHHPMER
jgi:hypothetical protein